MLNRKTVEKIFLIFITVFGTYSGSTVLATTSKELQGIWLQRGYARLLVITDQNLTKFDIASVSCTLAGRASLDEIMSTQDRIRLHSSEHFSWYETGNITRYDFDRLETLPTQCQPDKKKQISEPEATFEAFWHLFNENYAFFERRGVDWDQTYKKYRTRVNADTTNDALFTLLSDMIKPLNDGHVFVFDGVAGRGALSGSLGDVWGQWATENPELLTKWQVGHDPRSSFRDAFREFVAKEILQGKGKRDEEGTILWGWLTPDIGYIDVHSMSMKIEGNPNPSAADVAARTKVIMADVMNDLGSAKAIVIDGRFNSGGMDIMGLTIAGHFAGKKRLVSRKYAKYQEGWTKKQDIYIYPQGKKQYTGPLYYLAGRNSISATEIFTLAMLALPNATTLGTNTYGVLSDELIKVLPNGWITSISNEIYESKDGQIYEGSGVPPEVPIPLNTAVKLRTGIKQQLAQVIAMAKGK